MQKQRGFTLIELLVVIAIIAILATLVIVRLGSGQTKARNASAKSDITQLGKAVETYKVTNSTDFVVLSKQPDTTLSTPGTYLTDTTSGGGWSAIFATASTYPVTVNKTPSAAYAYGYSSDKGKDTANNSAANAAWATQTAFRYCVATNIIQPSGATDTAFFVKNGSTFSSTVARGTTASTTGDTYGTATIKGYLVTYDNGADDTTNAVCK